MVNTLSSISSATCELLVGLLRSFSLDLSRCDFILLVMDNHDDESPPDTGHLPQPPVRHRTRSPRALGDARSADMGGTHMTDERRPACGQKRAAAENGLAKQVSVGEDGVASAPQEPPPNSTASEEYPRPTNPAHEAMCIGTLIVNGSPTLSFGWQSGR
jgi:hypothetical protein